MIRKNIDTEKLELLVTGNLILPFEREGFPGPATTNDTEGTDGSGCGKCLVG